ncbi:MAG: hypothetical protein IPO29_05810 [Anaerolineae bacterium]|nr:hypothetical protein [Anaerolineae bacterium]
MVEAQLANQGTLNVNATMVLTQAGSTHTNTGTINLHNDLEIGGEFSNAGVMNFGSATLNAPSAPAQGFRVIGHSGLLANGPGGTINALQHAVVEAQLLNQGTLNVNATMVLTQPGSTHTNTGTINLNNDLNIGGEFSNAGVINFNSALTPTSALQPLPRGQAIWIQAGALNNAPSGTLNVLAPGGGAMPSLAHIANVSRRGRAHQPGHPQRRREPGSQRDRSHPPQHGVINVLADASFGRASDKRGHHLHHRRPAQRCRRSPRPPG